MAFQDLYEVVCTATIAGQKCINVFFYQQNNVLSGSDTAPELADRFVAEVIPKIRPLWNAANIFTNVKTRNLFDPSDADNRDVSLAGTNGGYDQMPNFNAYGFSLVQGNGAIKNGSKRIAGAAESSATGGVITDATFLTNLNLLGTQLAATLTDTLLNTWVPVVIGRILDGGVYRLPTNAGEAVFGAITSAVLKLLITSQVSRKVGVGA